MIFPADILYLIVEQVSATDHPLSYKKDTKTLTTLCLVSRDLNAIATSHLYSSIFLTSQISIQKLAETTKANSAILASCRDLRFDGAPIGASNLEAASIIGAATGLRRLFTRRVSWQFANNSNNLVELAFLDQHYGPYLPAQFARFQKLQRLAVQEVDFDRPRNVECLLALPSLTHLALARINVQNALGIRGIWQEDESQYLAGLTKFLSRKRAEIKLILGMDTQYNLTGSEHRTLRSKLDKLFSGEGLVYLEYGTRVSDRSDTHWFHSRVLDGTVWEMTQ
jgi:hypothetical protein